MNVICERNLSTSKQLIIFNLRFKSIQLEINWFMIDLYNSKYRFHILIVFILLSLSSRGLNAQNENNGEKPDARWGHVFVYDPINNQILLFGGKKESSDSFLNDTWICEGKKWKRLDVLGPSGRGFCAATFHEERKSIILHGGRGNDGQTYSDLWEWNGKGWVQLEDSSSYKADHHRIVYLKDQHAIFAFGGWNGKEVLAKTWIWADKWINLEITSPPKRASFSMTYNEATKKVNLFGGLWVNGQYADLWEWSYGQWHSLGGPYDNSSLDHHAMIYDEKLQQVIGFGGKNYRYKAQRTTFTIEKNKIKAITNEGPSGRHSFGFTYDSDSKAGYLFGGKEFKNGEQVALADFWKWDGENWKKIE